MKTAIVVHGCHLETENWEEIVYGDMIGRELGRIQAAIIAAREYSAQMVIWGTGASYKDGQMECEYTLQYAKDRFDELIKFCSIEKEELHRVLYELSVLSTDSQNTREEIVHALQVCKENDVDHIVLVSSPTHIARCLQECVKLDVWAEYGLKVSIFPSDTSFPNSTSLDVVIVEPPHRGDRPQIPFHKTVRQIFQFLGNEEVANDFNTEFQELINKHKARL